MIVDTFEQISEKVQTLVNELINNLINEKKRDDLLIKIYFQKCEDLKGRINNFLKRNQIYQTSNIRKDDNTSISLISSSECISSIGKAAPVAPIS